MAAEPLTTSSSPGSGPGDPELLIWTLIKGVQLAFYFRESATSSLIARRTPLQAPQAR